MWMQWFRFNKDNETRYFVKQFEREYWSHLEAVNVVLSTDSCEGPATHLSEDKDQTSYTHAKVGKKKQSKQSIYKEGKHCAKTAGT